MKNRGALIALMVIIGFALLIGVAFGTAWGFSAGFQERFFRGALMSGSPILERLGAEKLRDYPTSSSMISLVFFLNKVDTRKPHGADSARAALASLCLVADKNFGAEFTGPPCDYSMVPPSPEIWAYLIEEVNVWAVKTFGREAMGIIALTVEIEEETEEGGAEEEDEEEENEADDDGGSYSYEGINDYEYTDEYRHQQELAEERAREAERRREEREYEREQLREEREARQRELEWQREQDEYNRQAENDGWLVGE